MSNQYARQEAIYNYTWKQCVEEAQQDASSGLPDSADASASPAFCKHVMHQARIEQGRVLAAYSKAIEGLDAEAQELNQLLEKPSSKASMEWASKFNSSLHTPLWYWTIIAALFAADLVVNSYVFQSQVANLDALILAAILALSLFMFAKLAAIYLRQGPSMPARILGGILLVPPLAALWLAAEMRLSTVKAEGGQGSIAFFFGVNLLFFLTGVLISFVYETKLERAEKMLRATEQKRQRLFEKHGAAALEILDAGLWFMDQYRQYNDRAQGITCLWHTPPMPFPKALMRLHEPTADAIDVTDLALVDRSNGKLREVGPLRSDGDQAPPRRTVADAFGLALDTEESPAWAGSADPVPSPDAPAVPAAAPLGAVAPDAVGGVAE